jgi:hypothetical protein
MSNTNTITTEIRPLTLENVGGLALQQRFESAVESVAEEITAQLIEARSGKVKGRITIAIDVITDAESGATAVLADVTVRLPKAPRVGSPAMLKNGRVYVEPSNDHRQLTLVDPVHPTANRS